MQIPPALYADIIDISGIARPQLRNVPQEALESFCDELWRLNADRDQPRVVEHPWPRAWIRICGATEEAEEERSLGQKNGAAVRSRKTSSNPMCTLISGAHGANIPLFFHIGVEGSEVCLAIGTVGREAEQQLEALVRSSLSGSTLDTRHALETPGAAGHEIMLALAQPSPDDTTGGDTFLDQLIQGFWGMTTRLIVGLWPMGRSRVMEEYERLLKAKKAIEALGHVGIQIPTLQVTVGITHASLAEALLEKALTWYERGLASGLWHTLLMVETKRPNLVESAASLTLGVWAGVGSQPVVPRLIAVRGVAGGVPVTHNDGSGDDGLTAYIDSASLGAMLRLPRKEHTGFHLIPRASLGTNPPRDIKCDKQSLITLGLIRCHGEITATPFHVHRNQFTRHTLVSGSTGSGKTNAVFSILDQLYRQQIPFLVLEATKCEYHRLIHRIPDLSIYTLGGSVSPLRLNPFYFPEAIGLQRHLDYLRIVFTAALPMTQPLPLILEEALVECYSRRGFTLPKEPHSRESRGTYFPTLDDLIQVIPNVVNRRGYSREIQDNVRTALMVRVDSLRRGNKGILFNNRRFVDARILFESPTILELDWLVDDQEKALCMGLILVWLVEHLRLTDRQSQLRHVTVIEEAHRLLRRSAAVQTAGEFTGGDPRAQAVESFSSMLAEVRAFGEGLLVVEQLPSKLTPDVVKHTTTKIAGRQSSAEDREVIGADILMHPLDRDTMGRLDTGQFVVFTEGIPRPVEIGLPDYGVKWRLPAGTHDSDLPESKAALLVLPECDIPERCDCVCGHYEKAKEIIRSRRSEIADAFAKKSDEKNDPLLGYLEHVADALRLKANEQGSPGVTYCVLATLASREIRKSTHYVSNMPLLAEQIHNFAFRMTRTSGDTTTEG
jgi:DNA helicase HerA-like ATPase